MKYCLLFISILLCTNISLRAQTYQLHVSNEAYVPLADGISITDGEVWQSPFAIIPVGFNAQLFNFDVPEVTIANDGATIYTGQYDGGAFTAFLSPFELNIVDRGSMSTTSESEISYLTTGDPGERVFTIEWSNVGFYDELYGPGTNDNFINYQVKLFEATGAVRYCYGTSSITNSELVYEGESGPRVSLFEGEEYSGGEVYLLFDDPLNPQVFAEFDYFGNTFLNGTPPDGTVYEFLPLATGLDEPSLVEVQLFPNPVVDFVQVIGIDTMEPLRFAVYNSEGAIANQGDLINGRLNVKPLNKGFYVIQIQTKQTPA